jgi:Surface layer protein A domain
MPMPLLNLPQLSAQQVNPYSGATQQALGAYSQAVKAKYMPQQQQAEIFQKQFGPLAQIASNPVAMAMMGDQGKGVMSYIQQLLGGQNAGGGNTANPTNGLAQAGISTSGGNPAIGAGGGTPMPPSQTGRTNAYAYDKNGNNIVGNPETDTGQGSTAQPSTPGAPVRNFGQGNLGQNIVQKVTAPYQEPQHDKPYQQNGQVLDPATAATRESSQKIMRAVPAVRPLVEKLDDEAKDLLSNGRWFKLLSSAIATGSDAAGIPSLVELQENGGLDKFLKTLGITPEYYGKWVQFQKDQDDVAGRLNEINNYGENIPGKQTASSQVTPTILENYSQYHKRMQTELKKLDYNYDLAKQFTSSGFNATPGAPMEAPANPFKQPPGPQTAPQQQQATQAAAPQQSAANDYSMIGGPPGPKNTMGVREKKTINGKNYYRIGDGWFTISGMMGASGAQ